MVRTDEDIMTDFQSGDAEAAVMLFERYKMRIFHFCYGMLGNRADAEEASSEVFLAVIGHKDAYDPQWKFSTWIYTIARNKCLSQLRKRKHLLSLWASANSHDDNEEQELPLAAETDTAREALLKKEVALQVRRAIAKLPPEQKEAILLRQYHEMSYQEISNVLGCSLEKVKILIHRGREFLRVELTSVLKEEQL